MNWKRKGRKRENKKGRKHRRSRNTNHEGENPVTRLWRFKRARACCTGNLLQNIPQLAAGINRALTQCLEVLDDGTAGPVVDRLPLVEQQHLVEKAEDVRPRLVDGAHHDHPLLRQPAEDLYDAEGRARVYSSMRAHVNHGPQVGGRRGGGGL